MTHADAAGLLPLYALDALEPAEIRDLEAHLATCPTCAQTLRSFDAAAASLGSAAPRLDPPERLRARVLASGREALATRGDAPGLTPAAPAPTPALDASPPVSEPARAASGRSDASPPPAGPAPAAEAARAPARILRFPTRAPGWLAAAVLVVALAGSTAAGFARDAGDRSRLHTEDAALTLLTSTETTVERLEPVAAGLPADAHGHWYHRPGVPTQVIVGEFLPPIVGGQRYLVWERRGQAWQMAGALDGRGRLIVLGGDGADVTAVEVSREQDQQAQPGPDVVLRFGPPQ